jgi:hypothetical protein
VSAELNARRTAAAAVLADYRAAVASAPLAKPPGREWMLRLASVLDELLAGLDGLGSATVTLTRDQGATVARALADAEKYRMREAAEQCADCETDPRGCCDGCLDDLDAAQEYHDLGAELGRALPDVAGENR